MRMFKRSVQILVMLTALLVPGGLAWAQYGTPEVVLPEPPAPEQVTVMGHDVQVRTGLYEVTKDMNVRAGPATTFERIKSLKAGSRVRAVGKTEDGDWMAISKDGVTLGFAYAPILVPVVDGALSEQFLGSFVNPDIQGGISCSYRFRFERKSPVEGGNFETADYEIRFRCASPQQKTLFYAHMFFTEAPIHERKGLHLISLDVRSIGDGMEEYLTTSYLYHPKTGKMTFDGHSLPRFALPPKVQSYQTASIQDALKQALEASMASWTAEAWTTLFSKPQ